MGQALLNQLLPNSWWWRGVGTVSEGTFVSLTLFGFCPAFFAEFCPLYTNEHD